MRGFKYTIGVIAACLTFGIGTHQAAAQDISAVRIASGLNKPVFITHAPGDFERLFILEQDGRVRVMVNGVLQATPFLAIEGLVYGQGDPGWFNEQGLLGLAFHPDFQNNGKFYVNYTARSNDDTVVTEYTAMPGSNTADLSSARQIIRFSQDNVNHNGGWLGFGPNDGFLYIGTGDGGSGNDPFLRGQSLSTLLGKMLRIDVDGDDFPGSASANYAIPASNPFVGTAGAREEIWAYGIRNPWRNSFDRDTGDLYIGDVGQNAIEELNVQPANSLGGENYGWRCMEGTRCTGLSGCTCNSVALTMPIYDYSNAGAPCSVVAGYRYRGCAIPELDGTFFFTDYCSTVIQTFKPNATLDNFTDFTDRTAQLEPAGTPTINLISSFGEDAYGELYIVDLGFGTTGGEIYKIVPNDTRPRTDCDENGIEDACEILDGSGDADGNGIIDACDVAVCQSDFNNDGVVDIIDFGVFGTAFGSSLGDPNYVAAADFNNDDVIDIIDFGVFGMEFNRTDCPIMP